MNLPVRNAPCGCKQLGVPTTVTGKVQKFALREMFVAEGAAG